MDSIFVLKGRAVAGNGNGNGNGLWNGINAGGFNPASRKGRHQSMVGETEEMDMEKLKKAGIALAAAYLVFKFGKGEAMKAAALGVAGVVVAKQIPYVADAL